MCVGPPITERVHAGLMVEIGGPWYGFRWNADAVFVERDIFAWVLEMDVRENDALFQHEHALDQSCKTSGAFEMPDLKVNVSVSPLISFC